MTYEEELSNLGARLAEYTQATEQLAGEVHESKELTEAIRKTQRRQGITQLSVLVCIVLLIAAISIQWHSQQQQTQIAKQAKAIATAVASCTTPGGACKQLADKQFNTALEYLRDTERDDRLQDNIASAQAQGNQVAVDTYSKIEAQVSQQILAEMNQLKALQAQTN